MPTAPVLSRVRARLPLMLGGGETTAPPWIPRCAGQVGRLCCLRSVPTAHVPGPGVWWRKLGRGLAETTGNEQAKTTPWQVVLHVLRRERKLRGAKRQLQARAKALWLHQQSQAGGLRAQASEGSQQPSSGALGMLAAPGGPGEAGRGLEAGAAPSRPSTAP